MTSSQGIRCLLMRGGTSKGAFFVPDDVPSSPAERDDLLQRIMGTPDPTQIDGIGGATTLTSKVAIVSASASDDADLDYLFLQLGVERPTVSTLQTCGNLLAAVGPFALERGLVTADAHETTLRIRLLNTGDVATARLRTPDGAITYEGDTSIDGVPGTAAPVELEVEGAAPLLPTGNPVDVLDGHRATLVDNGMPVVALRADEFGLSGNESPEALEADATLVAAIERIRVLAGEAFGLGDVREQSVPKMILVSPPRHGGMITVRAFIPHRVHTSIGVLMAASIAAAARIPGTLPAEVAEQPQVSPSRVEHPSGTLPTSVDVRRDAEGAWRGTSASTRTARKLFDGVVFPRPAESSAPELTTANQTASTAHDGPRG